jgi:hypothetical protein
MKRRSIRFLIMTIVIIAHQVICINTFAQSPQKMSYQAVIRNSSGDIIPNTSIGMRVSILLGSSTGTEIYKETYSPNPQSNAYGIVILEIGNGIPQTGTFSNIDWSVGPYYIKIETDPTGGINYTISSTSQLLSVPYAFYSVNSGASVPAHYIGQFYGGGVIYYVDHTGNHGLICSLIDLSTANTWSDHPTTLIGPTAQSDWNGKNNSAAMIFQSTTTSAADICSNYSNTDYGTGVFNDWYLPAIDQLSLLYHAKYQINKAIETDANAATTVLVKNSYWSSTECSSTSAWAYDFITGTVIGNDKLCTPIHIRTIRDF